jgi:acyl-CoA dehydrogenase
LRNRHARGTTLAGREKRMDFTIPADLEAYYAALEAFIESVIEPLVAKDDNVRFFDHRREHARTDWEAGGLPRPE